MASEKLEIIILAKDQASRVLKRMGGGFSKLNKLAKGLALGGLGLATAGFVGLGAALKTSVALAGEQQRVEQQLDQVLVSTGNAAGLTADQVKRMASELQNVTTYGDEAIIAGQNLLLTFTNIGSQAFPRATEVMLDMSTALGQDLKSSAIQLGKALNDPIQGVSALQRVGVSFTEQQKEQIKAMAESGDVMGAQSLILDELERQFGGSAAAAADTFGGRVQQLKNAVGDFGEQIGFALMPTLTDLAEAALPKVQAAITKVQEILPNFASAIQNAFAGETELAIQDFQRGLYQLGFSPEQIQTITDDSLSISESVSRIIDAFTGPEAEKATTILDAITTSVDTLARALENLARFSEVIGDQGIWAALTSEEFAPGPDPLGQMIFGEGGSQGAFEGIREQNRPAEGRGFDNTAVQALIDNIFSQPIILEATMDGEKVAELVSRRQSQRLAATMATGGHVGL